MSIDSIQILAISITLLTVIKLSYMFAKRNSWSKIIELYSKSTTKYSWRYFITYFSLAIFSLYILRSANISYTTIVAALGFIAFLINCAFIAMPSMYDGLDFSKINWTMMGVYTFTWLFIMFKSLQEIFNF